VYVCSWQLMMSQAIWAGYGGVRVIDCGIFLTRPRPPPGTSKLVLSRVHIGSSYISITIEQTSSGVVTRISHEGGDDVSIDHGER
jgi:hypothetical protein